MSTKPTSPRCKFLTGFIICTLLTGAPLSALAQVPALPDVPATLPAKALTRLNPQRDLLAKQREAFLIKGKAHNQRCNDVVLNTAEASTCAESRNSVVAEMAALREATRVLQSAIDAAWTIAAINNYVKQGPRPWDSKERERLDKALNALAFSGDPDATGRQIREAWHSIVARGQPDELVKKAASGSGPGFYSAGRQSHEDCAAFSIANASGRPYGVVAAMANKFITEGEWRSAADRENSQKAIELRGLIGGEVILLAEAFGQVKVVEHTAFAQTLKQGHPVMINLVPDDGDVDKGHQVVLTKTFQHTKTTWYQIMDSNQEPSNRRYLTAAELWTLMQENGVSVRPEPRTVPKLLR